MLTYNIITNKNNNKEVVSEWEYRITYPESISSEQQELNMWGTLGWELVQVDKKTIERQGKPNIEKITHYFKRPKRELDGSEGGE